jgi:hypothetical protein
LKAKGIGKSSQGGKGMPLPKAHMKLFEELGKTLGSEHTITLAGSLGAIGNGVDLGREPDDVDAIAHTTRAYGVIGIALTRMGFVHDSNPGWFGSLMLKHPIFHPSILELT